MIIYAETLKDFIEDVDLNQLESRLVNSFKRQTGGVPSDRNVWADEYKIANVLRRATVDDDIQVALEYHISTAGRLRPDAMLIGNDGEGNAPIFELKAWSDADKSEIPEMVWAPYGGGRDSQHPCVQARKHKSRILNFNADIVEKMLELNLLPTFQYSSKNSRTTRRCPVSRGYF